MPYNYDINEIKESLTIEQVFDLLTELHGEPIIKGNMIISKTICHHSVEDLGEASHKLYYYDNTHLFRCYTGCGDSFDIFELIRKVKNYGNENNSLPKAISFVANYFNFAENEIEEDNSNLKEYLNSIKNYSRVKNYQIDKQIVELKVYKDDFLKNLPHPIIKPWIEENISEAAMKKFEIAYDPKNEGIVIPHRDIKGNLIGVRERTLIKENAERFGKYLPMKIGNKMYNHPLSFSLYGIYQNKENIKNIKKAIVVESEKSVLQLENILKENNIGVACCGSSLINYQVQLLLNLGVTEIIVGFDHDWRNVEEEAAKRKIKNLKNIQKKYGNLIKITYLWDINNLTGYKCSPTDCGTEIFWKLMNSRINLY